MLLNQRACHSIIVHVCQSTCMSVNQLACMSINLHVCQSTCMSVNEHDDLTVSQAGHKDLSMPVAQACYDGLALLPMGQVGLYDLPVGQAGLDDLHVGQEGLDDLLVDHGDTMTFRSDNIAQTFCNLLLQRISHLHFNLTSKSSLMPPHFPPPHKTWNIHHLLPCI